MGSKGRELIQQIDLSVWCYLFRKTVSCKMVEYMLGKQFITFAILEAIGSISYYNNIKICICGDFNLHT